MSSTSALAACLVALLLLGVWERILRDRARAAVPIRIHVNGTRGKSTVTRLIWAALREAGVPAVAKTTGTAPRVLLPDGTEQPVRRLGPANIREQLWLLRLARRTGARALVAECMAIRPDLQSVSEREMIDATIGVITNVRCDHTEVMGRTPEDIAASMANTIPRRGVLITGDAAFSSLLEARAALLGSRVVVAMEREETDRSAQVKAASLEVQGEPRVAGWLEENRRVTLAVTRQLGISDEIALAGMASAPADPGAAWGGCIDRGDRRIPFLDATAANDPESLDRLLRDFRPLFAPTGEHDTRSPGEAERLVVVFNHRWDRPDRLRVFASDSPCFASAGLLIVTGAQPSSTLWRTVHRVRGGRLSRFVPVRGVATVIEREAAAAAGLVFCGNTRGFDVREVLGRSSSRG
jgi:gamma-polyglutamate synthase